MNPFYAMDTAFDHEPDRYRPAAKARLLRELGYAGTNCTLLSDAAWDDLPALIAELDGAGLELFTIYLEVDVHTQAIDARLAGALRRLAGRATLVELSLTSSGEHDKPSSPRADARAAEVVRAVGDMATPLGLRVSLYPHESAWLERVEDAVRLAMRVNRANVGVTFNLFHWLAVDGEELEGRLQLALPRLLDLTLNGATRHGPRRCDILTLDRGTFDNLAFLARVSRLGYTGPIGLQGYGIGGDVEANLRRSMAAWRDMNKRLRNGER